MTEMIETQMVVTQMIETQMIETQMVVTHLLYCLSLLLHQVRCVAYCFVVLFLSILLLWLVLESETDPPGGSV